MPIIGSFGAGSASGFGQRQGKRIYNVRYLVLAGGGGGGGGPGQATSGGGGAGGYRTVACKSFEVENCESYTVTVGATAGATSVGNSSAFECIASTGGGVGGNPQGTNTPQNGGSGAGPGGTGNAGGYSPPEGNPAPATGGGGAGGPGSGTTGGPGATSNITGSCVTYGGGGGGGANGANGGPGGGGRSVHSSNPAINGSNGLGAGGGGHMGPPGPHAGGSGGSGRVIIRRETAASCTTSGSVTTSGDDTIHTFNSSGTYVA